MEHEVKERIRSLARDQGVVEPAGPWPFYPLKNLQGIDIETASVQLTRVTLWMGQRQMMDRYGEAEPALPLQDLSGVVQADALRTPWLETDCIIGNPPFQGASHVRRAVGDDYVDWLKREFRVGVKDLCTYWFRRAADHLKQGQRAGLVGTNSISQNFGRSASLSYVESKRGVITDAISSQKWPGEAKVHVSIVNWVQEPEQPITEFLLDGVTVCGITTSLRPGVAGWVPQGLSANRGRCFEGPSPKAGGFQLSLAEVEQLLTDRSVDYRQVVRPYLTARDIADDPQQRASRWTVDFGLRTLEEAMAYPLALELIRERVKPEREENRRKVYREKWWRFAEPRTGMRAALAGLERYVVMARHGKRAIFAWCDRDVLASDATKVFAFEDDYSMGMLLSKPHGAWAWDRSGTFKADLRYTNSTSFMTLPWPDPTTAEHRERVAEASRRLLVRRTDICITEQIGLTKLYNAVDDGAWTDLKAMHRELDEAVVDCYGWSRAAAQSDAELVRLLTQRNREVAEGNRPYAPFG